jgi:dimethylhistidine N-methyltransferase
MKQPETASSREGKTERAAFLQDVLAGLSKPQKDLPCKYFYDELGSKLFEQICELDEYYLTRADLEITTKYGADMAGFLGRRCLLIEFGSGSSLKTRLLLNDLQECAGYVPVDLSRDSLARAASSLSRAYPNLEILPVCADFTGPFDLPAPAAKPSRRAVYFPGSTIGNLHPDRARVFLAGLARLVGRKGGLLIGIDLKKDPALLEAAYDDGRGVTAKFNLNLLARINRELGANFDLERFRHRAVYNAEVGRVEMHLVSVGDQTVLIEGRGFALKDGETIWTESSYKYDLDRFKEMAASSGFESRQVWTDERGWFAEIYFEAG